MRNHPIATVLSAGTVPALFLLLGAAAPPSLPRAAAAATRAVAGSRAAAPEGTWGKAEQVPGTAALNTGGAAEVRSVSCGSAGNCGAGGTYGDRSGHGQAFVISEVNGTWGTARQVAGTLNTRGNAQIYTLSCGSPGNCGAGGYYRDSSGHYQAFVVTEHNGAWGRAREVAAALNTGGNAAIGSVSCASAGNCSAGGFYAGAAGHPRQLQALVVDEVHGSWGNATEVPGTAALNQGGNAVVESVSCASARHCSAGGYYFHTSSIQQTFVASKG